MARKSKTPLLPVPKLDAVPPDLLSELESLDLKPREFKLILSMVTATTNQELCDMSGYSMRTVMTKKKELAPLIERVAAVCRRQALAKAAMLAPKAMNALDELLDAHKGSTSDTKRKTAESILDRAVGRPPAKVSVERKSTQQVQIVFPNWSPQAIEGETIGSEEDQQLPRNMLATPSGTPTKEPISEKEENSENLQPRPGGSTAPVLETKEA